MRTVTTYTETAAGRDNGKVFVITEMGARPAHRWATRLMFAVMNAGIELPDGVENMGLAGIAGMGMAALGKISFDQAEPLLDELLACVAYVPDPANAPGNSRKLFESDIEEFATIFRLQKAVFDLHIEPFITGVKSISALTPATTTGG